MVASQPRRYAIALCVAAIVVFCQHGANARLVAPPPPPQLRRPLLAPQPPPELPLKLQMSTGPFGGSNPNGTFDDSSLAGGGSNNITAVAVRTGSWIDAIQFTYGTTNSSWHGGAGGPLTSSLVLAADEFIQEAWVRSGLYVDEIRFSTNMGRTWSTFGSTSGDGDPGVLASPCPVGAYRLIAVKGIGNQFLDQIEFVWGLVPGARGPPAASVAQWSCMVPGASPAIRTSSKLSQPECMSTDGVTCVQHEDCLNLRMCGQTPGWTPVTCAASDGATDPLHWCSRARGALGLPSPTVPIRIIFFNVNICDSGLAVANNSRILNTLYTDPYSLKNYWTNASFGRAELSEATSAVVNITLPCESFPVTECSMDAWAAYVATNAGALLGNLNLADYQFQVYLAPNIVSCAEVGIGYAGGDKVWIRGDYIDDLNIFKHEIGHALTLPHSSRVSSTGAVEEYGDSSTPMGFCPRCIYASPHQVQLGWSRPGPPIDWSAVTSGTSLSFTIKPLTDVAGFDEHSVLWVHLEARVEAGVGSEGGVQDLFISYRAKKGIDASLPEQFDQATSVHGLNGNTWLLAYVKTGQAYVNAANRLVVLQQQGSSEIAQVSLCKYASLPSECGVFTTFIMPS